MKHLFSFPSLLAALCLAIPATGFSDDHHHYHGGDWHGHYYGPGFHHYRPYLPFVGLPFFGVGYYGPSFGVSIDTDADPAPAYAAPAYRGARVDDRGDDLAFDVQRALHRDGYYRGDLDGDIGAGTRAAIRQYQYDHRLEVTGRIDRALLDSLGLD